MAQLASVKYSSILPLGKTGNYVENQKIQFDINNRYSYIDGKQSYILLKVDNTSTQSSAPAGAVFPAQFPPHVGGHALFQRMDFREKPSSKLLESIDAYNSYVACMKSYGHDKDEYATMSMVEKVSAHNPLPQNRACDEPQNNYFQPPASEEMDLSRGSNVALTSSVVLPIHLGLFSNIGADEHMALPNGAIGGTQLDIILERADVALSCQAHNLQKEEVSGVVSKNSINVTDNLGCDAYLNTDTFVNISLDQCDLSKDVYGKQSPSNCAFRTDMAVQILANDGTTINNTLVVTEVATDGNKIQVRFNGQIGSVEGVSGFIRAEPPTYSYKLQPVLRVLETVPSNPSSILQALQKGINYKTTMLNKLSSPQSLINQVLDIPAVVERAISLWVLPSIQNNLNAQNESNSRLYPQMETGLQYNYQWQILNYLIPNRQVEINKVVNRLSDNTIYYKQLEVAMRDILENGLQAFIDGQDSTIGEISNTMIIPIQLAPNGRSFKLLDADAQLRLENENITNGAMPTIEAKLYHIYTNHTRTLMSNSEGNMIML